ncbi:MAG TPA: GFA family protein, partial [Leucothrix mucor]|nr:GFA family protein [Leucothrix mucor]
ATDDTDIIEFSLGTLDSDIELRPDAHVFTAYKANWVKIYDRLPQHKEKRGSGI